MNEQPRSRLKCGATLVHTCGSVEQPIPGDVNCTVLQFGSMPSDVRIPRRGQVQSGPLEAFTASFVRMKVNNGVLFSTDGTVVRRTNRGKTVESPYGASVDRAFGADDAVFVAYNAGWRNYYHFIIQSAFSTWALTKLFKASEGKFLFPPLSRKCVQILEHCGLAAERTVFLERNAIVDFSKVVCINSTYFRRPSTLLANFGRDMAVQAQTSTGKRRHIYVSRKDSQKRRIANEAEVEEFFSRRGFVVVVPSTLSFREQIEVFGSADVVVAPHGAALTNTIFCAPGVKIVELMSDSYVNDCFVNLSRALGLRHTLAIFCGAGHGDGVGHWESWSIDLKAVESTMRSAECW